MEIDIELCEDCGVGFDAMASACDALEESLSFEVIFAEMCAICRPRLLELI